jgi:hypothetical protein
LTIVGFAGSNTEGNAEGGPFIETAIRFLHFRLVQLVLRKHYLLQVLYHVHTALVFLRLWTDGEDGSFILKFLHEGLPLFLLANQRGREVDLVWVIAALGLGYGAIDL